MIVQKFNTFTDKIVLSENEILDKETASEIYHEYVEIYGKDDININKLMNFYLEDKDDFSYVYDISFVKKELSKFI